MKKTNQVIKESVPTTSSLSSNSDRHRTLISCFCSSVLSLNRRNFRQLSKLRTSETRPSRSPLSQSLIFKLNNGLLAYIQGNRAGRRDRVEAMERPLHLQHLFESSGRSLENGRILVADTCDDIVKLFWVDWGYRIAGGHICQAAHGCKE